MQVSITSNHNRNIGYRQSGNLAHNRREFIPRNVDRELIRNNIILKSKILADVYEESFGDAIDDYNSKQKRKDRIKYDRESYFKNLFGVDPESESARLILTSNARGKHEMKSFNEELFQVGDCYEFGHFMRDRDGNLIDKNGDPIKWKQEDNTYYDIHGNPVTDSSSLVPNPKAEKAKEILSIFYTGGRFKVVKDQNGVPSLQRLEDNDPEKEDLIIPSFEERNPNFRIICAIIHNDEWHGTPHIHIDYVPVGEGYVKGPEKQLGFERALKNMGFENKNTAYKEWRDKERMILKEVCNYYGLETKTKEEERENNRGKTYSTKEYNEIIRTARADAQRIRNQAMKEAAAIKERAVQEAQAIIDGAMVVRRRAEEDADIIKKQAEEDAQAITDEASAEANRIIDEAQQEAAEIQAESKKLAEKNEHLQLAIDDKENHLHDVDNQLVVKLDIAAKIPKTSLKDRVGTLLKKLFKGSSVSDDDSEIHMLTKQEYDEYTAFYELLMHYVQNKIVFDEDVQQAENERKHQEQLRANMQQEIRQHAKEIAKSSIQKEKADLEREKHTYKKLKNNQKHFILQQAKKIAEHTSPSFAKLNADEQERRLNRAFVELGLEFEDMDENEKDDELSL